MRAISAAPAYRPHQRRFTSLDSQFLALETPRQSGHVASVAILDTSTTPTGTLALADVQALIASGIRLAQLC